MDPMVDKVKVKLEVVKVKEEVISVKTKVEAVKEEVESAAEEVTIGKTEVEVAKKEVEIVAADSTILKSEAGIVKKEVEVATEKQVMAVKKEKVAAVSGQDILNDQKRGFVSKDAATPHSEASFKVPECWMAPVKPERSLASKIVKEEKKGVIVQVDTLKKMKSDAMMIEYAELIDSPLRFCPKFEKMSDCADEAVNEDSVGKVKNGTTKTRMLVEECDEFLESPLRFCPKFEKMRDYDDCKSTCKSRVDFSGGELVDDFEDEIDNITIIGSKYGVINTRCPLSGKLVTELDDPVQSINCHHVYDRGSALAYIDQYHGLRRCAVAGCSRSLIESDLVSDPALRESIQDLRQKNFTAEVKLMMECIRIDSD